MERPHVVVIGGGFAGLWCTRALKSASVRITLIDRANYHLFQPLLYQVATGGLSAPDISAPLRHILRKQRNASVLLADVVAIDPLTSTVCIKQGDFEDSLHFDFLVVAAGARHSYFGQGSWEKYAPGLKTLDDALSIRKKIFLAFERAELAKSESERRAWLNFAVVGAGPTGVELAGTLAEIARHTLLHEFRNIDPQEAQVRLIEAGPAPLASFPVELRTSAIRKLEGLGVEVVCGTPVSDISESGYQLAGTFVPCRTVLWAAGVVASPLGASIGAPLDRVGRVIVNRDLSVPSYQNIFVAGDLASVVNLNGGAVPGVATAAKQMGNHAAKNIRRMISGGSSLPFSYVNHGNLATIGRMAAVVDLGRLKMSGILAWWFWLAVHVFFLIGFKNRLSVLLNWAVSYWTYQRGSRIMVGNEDWKGN